MSSSAFFIRHRDENNDPVFFASQFLASQDFDDKALKDICSALGLPHKGNENTKNDRVDRLSKLVKTEGLQQAYLLQLINRHKGWMSFRLLESYKKFPAADPSELLTDAGGEKWYGPIDNPDDGNSVWYIFPHFVRSRNEEGEGVIRWLSFARFSERSLSLHWKGFTYKPPTDDDRYVHTIPFPYWRHIPDLIKDVIWKSGAKVTEVDLANLSLEQLWNRYRGKEGYEWNDYRIRAEASGATMNAHGGAKKLKGANNEIIEIGGIRSVAQTLRDGVSTYFADVFPIPEPILMPLQDVILSILIKNLGSLSYEFGIVSESVNMRLNMYFGFKPDSMSADRFAHFHALLNHGRDLDQLELLLDHL